MTKPRKVSPRTRSFGIGLSTEYDRGRCPVWSTSPSFEGTPRQCLAELQLRTANMAAGYHTTLFLGGRRVRDTPHLPVDVLQNVLAGATTWLFVE